jgi:hypothetical protein
LKKKVQTSNYRGRSISAGPLRERLKQTLITVITFFVSCQHFSKFNSFREEEEEEEENGQRKSARTFSLLLVAIRRS